VSLPPPAPPAAEWIDGRAAAAILGHKTPKRLVKLAESRMIGVRAIPGARPMFKAEDVVRVASESTRPALASA
jgi:hypothetical protein